jgi:large subunit ribosomal protein L2
MALKSYNPTSPSMRQLVTVDRSELHKGKPVKTLTEGLTSSGGRNNLGRITTRFRGRTGKRSDFKKAIVTLAEGQAIDVTTGI